MDDLIIRLRALMAELEHRLTQGDVLHDEDISPKLKEALASGTERGTQPTPLPDLSTPPDTYQPRLADDPSATRARQIKLDDYVPSREGRTHEGFDPEDFIGTGDSDPLGHDAMARGR